MTEPTIVVLGIHVELPFAGVQPCASNAPLDFDQLQILRAIQRPILSATNSYALADVVESSDRNALVIVSKEDITWEDGCAVVAADIASSIEKSLSSTPGLRELLDVRSITVDDESCGRVRIATRAPAVLAELLTDIRFAPRERASGAPGFTGAFTPTRSDGRAKDENGNGGPWLSYRSRPSSRGPSVVLSPLVLSSPKEAIEAFDAGRIVATCPAMFELAAAATGAATKSKGSSGMVLQMIVHPRLRRWSSAGFRADVLRTIATPPEAAEVLVRECLSGEFRSTAASSDGAAGVEEGRPLRLLYGDYWPNHQIAECTRQALVDLGVRDEIVLEGVSLPNLVARISSGDFDFALTIQVETTRVSPLITAAAGIFAGAPEQVRAILGALVRETETGCGDPSTSIDRLAAWLFAVLPTVPLFRFRTHHFTTDRRLVSLDAQSESFLCLERLVLEQTPSEDSAAHAA